MKFINKKWSDSCLVGQNTAIETVSEVDTRRENCHKKWYDLKVVRKKESIEIVSEVVRVLFFLINF